MRHLNAMRAVLVILLVLCGTGVPVFAGGSVVPVGTYLYANPPNADQITGRLTVKFAVAGNRMVIAYGHKYRKDRKPREDTIEAERELFKPYLAKVKDQGATAVFEHLPPDFYDLVIIRADNLTLYEGLLLLQQSDPKLATPAFFEEIKTSLDVTKDKIGGWEAFFDTKKFERFETDGTRGCVLVQQLRRGKAFAESGEELKGCIHSIDICWVERGKVEGAGWQVVTRQQLYRDELSARDFFASKFVPELQGVRIGTKAKEIGPISLP